jgi:hypothetical protein
MTTYTRITCGCPIVRRCLRHLHDSVKSRTYSLVGDPEDVEELTRRGNIISTHPDLVKLRGFLAVEEMLKPIVHLYDNKYKRAGESRMYLELRERTWIELTHLKIGLEVLLDQVNIDLAEMQLGGTSFRGDVTVLAHGERAASGLRGLAAQRLKPLLDGLIASIVALRPYLRNEDVSVACVGEHLCQAMGLVIPKAIEVVSKLVEAQL